MTSPSAPLWQVERDADGAVLRLSGDWLARETGLRSEAELRQIDAVARSAGRLRVDTSRVRHWDSALVVFVARLDAFTANGVPQAELDLSGLPSALRRLLTLARADHASAPGSLAQPRVSMIDRAGMLAIGTWASVVASAELLGAGVLSVPLGLTGRLRARAFDIVALMQDCGFGALAIVCVVNGLVGAILGFVGAVQLRRFGAEIYVVNLIGIAVVREMAPIMTAIVMAGRTGGAYAAQIATMQGNEEIDALQALGVPVHQFLVVPRIIAAVTMIPILYMYGSLLGLLGGLATSVAMLHMSPAVFLEYLRPAVRWTEFAIGFAKSICFGVLIAVVACRTGLESGRSSAEVGRAATSAVVQSIIGIIALDAIFAACAEIMGI